MTAWRSPFKHDPIPSLMGSADRAFTYFVRRDLLDEPVSSIDEIWDLPVVQKILKKQLPDGSWKYPGKHKEICPGVKYGLLETWKQLRFLVDMYGMDRSHPAVRQAAEYVFSCQTKEGDIRGFLADQYMPYYHGAIRGLLNKAGFYDDPRVEKGMRWLLEVRQKDGGWALALLAGGLTWKEICELTSRHHDTVGLDPTQPFSHNITGMAIRAFAHHPGYRRSKEALSAGRLLKSRFFQKDAYNSMKHPDYWVRFQYPFWWNSLIAATDSLTLMGFPGDDPDIQKALNWFRDNQEENGLWRVNYMKRKKPVKYTDKVKEAEHWITLAICRIYKRLY